MHHGLVKLTESRLEEAIELDKLAKAHTLSADAIRNVIRSAALQTLLRASEVVLLVTADQAFFTRYQQYPERVLSILGAIPKNLTVCT
ncbi:MAG TPA: hypothetical protein VES89_08020 [Candidatus Competibacteraceae bacterium]|nr:hypothetical protein [Candidatus Competibacteraceae bacterium]